MNLADIYHFEKIVYRIISATYFQKYEMTSMKTKAPLQKLKLENCEHFL